MTTDGKPNRYLPLPFGDGAIVIKHRDTGQIRWVCNEFYEWSLRYSYDPDGKYRLAIDCERSTLVSDLDLSKMFTTIQQLIESGVSDGRTPVGFRL